MIITHGCILVHIQKFEVGEFHSAFLKKIEKAVNIHMDTKVKPTFLD